MYEGDSSDGTLIGEYSGSAVPASLVSYTGSMYVEFTTSDAQLESAPGFVAKYEVNFDLDCSANQLLDADHILFFREFRCTYYIGCESSLWICSDHAAEPTMKCIRVTDSSLFVVTGWIQV